jgi:hypothetical protein
MRSAPGRRARQMKVSNKLEAFKQGEEKGVESSALERLDLWLLSIA